MGLSRKKIQTFPENKIQKVEGMEFLGVLKE